MWSRKEELPMREAPLYFVLIVYKRLCQKNYVILEMI